MVTFLRWFLVGFAVVVLTACGGGGSGVGQTTPIESYAKGIAQLGYISGGKVSLYALDDLQNPMAETKTATSQDLTKVGRFTFSDLVLEDSSYYLVTVTGGEDIDADDNGILDDTPTALKGIVHAVVSGAELKRGIKVNAYTDMAYEKLADDLQTMTTSEISEALDRSAKEYLFDVDGDDSIDYGDILSFDPLRDKDKTKKSYSDILDIYIPHIYANEARSKKLSALMYIDSPKIIVENGRLQEVPFILKATLINQPDGLRAEWAIDNTELSPTGMAIDKDGIYKITAKLYKGDTLVKTVSTDVIATNKEEVASTQASPDKESKIILTTDVNSSLAGTKIYIPKGALKEDTKIVVKKASVNVVPGDSSAVSISDALVLEPSGLTFDKPVQVRLPYDENLDLNKSNVRIARYSGGGKIDYIVPLYIDKENHDVVFETEHFTEFTLETTVGFERYKENQTEIQDIEKEIGGTEYTNDEWFNILNYKLLDDTVDFTVYDLYLEHKTNEKVYDLYNKANRNVKYYAEAYNSIYTDNAEVISSQSRWNEVKKGLELINVISSVGGKLANGKYKKAANDTIEHVLGIDLPNDPEEIASWSNPYDPIQLGDALVKTISNNAVGNQIKKYFILRDSGLNPEYCFDSNTPGTETNENGWYTTDLIYGEGDLIKKKSSPNFWKNVEKLYQRIQKYKTNNFKSSFRDTVEKVKKILDDISEKEYYEKNPTATFYPYTNSKKRVEINVAPSITNRVSYRFKIHTKGYTEDNFFFPRFELRDSNNKVIEKLEPLDYKYNETGGYTGYYSGEFVFDVPKKEGTYDYSIYFEDDKLTDIIDVSGRLYLKMNVKSPRQKIAINNIEVSGRLDEDATSYKVILSPEFDSMAHPPVRVVTTLNGKSHENSLTIPKRSFDDTSLYSIPVTVTMSDDYKDTYEMKPYSTTINVKALLDKALKDREGNIEDQSTVVPELIATSSRKITVGETVTFVLDRRNVSDIIRNVFYGTDVRKTIEDNSFIYTVTYGKQGVKFPRIEVKLKDGTFHTLKSKPIFVSNVPDNTDENTNPVANPFQSYTLSSNTSVDILLEVSDADNDSLTPEYKVAPSHGKLLGTGAKITYVANQDYVGPDKFTYVVKDGRGGVSDEATVMLDIIATAPVENKYVAYVTESEPKDNCKTYSQTGCEALVERGQSFVKSWTVRNVGNVELSGLKMQLVEDDTGLDVSVNSLFPRTLNVNKAGSFKLNIIVPDNVLSGVHKALYKLVDNNGDLHYKSNGEIAYVWYKYKVTDNLPTIILKDVPTAVENSAFTFEALLSDTLDSTYTVKLSLGDGGGGWLSPEEMIASGDKKSFALAKKITKPGDRRYRVAIFRGAIQVSDWVEGSYKVYSKAKIPQNIAFKQTQEGVEISWDPVQGAKNYSLYTTMDWTKDGELMEIQGSPAGDEWLSDTSYLFKKRYFKDHKVWYFAVSADNGPVSERYRFEWVDQVVDNDYTKYLAGNSLYFLSAKDIVTEMQFNDDLTSLSYESNGTLKRLTTKLDNNGLKLDDSNVYFIIKSVHQDYLEMEMDELSDSGVIIDRKKSFELYFDEQKVLQFDGDLAQIIVGKTFYQHCKNDNGDVGIDKITFQNNGKIKIVEHGADTFYIEYSINDNVVLTKDDDGNEEVHTFAKETNEYIQFNEDSGEVTTLYKTYQLAENAPVDDCGGGDAQAAADNYKVSDLVSGKVHFKDENGASLSVPSDAWVRITPSRYQIEGQWDSVNCKLDSDGNFGNECYIHRDEADMRTAFNDSSETFQVIVYAETINDTHYNPEEQSYGFIGNNVSNGSWNNFDIIKQPTAPIDNTLTVNVSMAGNTLTAVFNKDMLGDSSTTGDYIPVQSYWTDARTFKIDFSSYTSGGTIVLRADGFKTTEGKRMAEDVQFVFP